MLKARNAGRARLVFKVGHLLLMARSRERVARRAVSAAAGLPEPGPVPE